jgi:actin-like protein 6A
MYTGDDVAALVVDLGTSVVKAGFAGDDTPKATYPTVRKKTIATNRNINTE